MAGRATVSGAEDWPGNGAPVATGSRDAPFALVFSDMDDTFLAHDKSVPTINMDALDALAEAGVTFVPCTGRAVASLPDEVMRHPATAYVVACNGASVYDVATDAVIRARRMPASTVLAAYGVIADLDVTFDVFAGDRILTDAARFEHAMGSFGLDAGTVGMLRAVRTPVHATTPKIIEAAGEAIDKVTVYWGTDDDRRRAAAALAGVADIAVTSSHVRNLEFMAAGVGKGEALDWLARYVGVDAGATVAFGDSPNDASMLAAATYGVAVANATGDAIAAAGEICASCDEGGPGRWLLEHLRWPRERMA